MCATWSKKGCKIIGHNPKICQRAFRAVAADRKNGTSCEATAEKPTLRLSALIAEEAAIIILFNIYKELHKT